MSAEHGPRLSRRDFLKVALSVMAVPPLGSLVRAENRFSSELASSSLEFMPEKTMEKTGEFVTKEPLYVTSFPLRADQSYDPKRTLTTVIIPAGFNFGFKDLYFFKDKVNTAKGQEIIRTTVLPDTMGHNDIYIGMVDRGSFDGRGIFKPFTGEVKGIDTVQKDIYGTMTYLVGDLSIYPNKVHNLLRAFINTLKYQEENGPLDNDKVRSYIEMIKLRSTAGYVKGYNSSGYTLIQGGVCAGATLIANSMFRMAEKLGVDFEETYEKPRDFHPAPYRLGPYSPPFRTTDTTVEIAASGKVTDYKIIAPEKCYISPKIALIPNGVPFKETAQNGLGLPAKDGTGKILRSDVFLALNISLTKTPPKETSASLEEMLTAFNEFRSSDHKKGANIISKGGEFLGDFDWDQSTDQVSIVEKVFPENDTSEFGEEITGSPYLREVLELSAILNGVTDSDVDDVSSYLRKSDWYLGKQIMGIATPRLEVAINQLNSYRRKDQPIQCVQWAALIAGLEYDECPVNIGGVKMRGPNDIVPKDILNSPYRQTAQSPTGGIMIADRYMEMTDYRGGQLFLMANTDVGHVGVILSTKKLANGETVILATEANRVNTGKIQMYTIRKHNFNAKLGNPPNKKIIIDRVN